MPGRSPGHGPTRRSWRRNRDARDRGTGPARLPRCGTAFELSARNTRIHRNRGTSPKCDRFRYGARVLKVTEAHRRWWLKGSRPRSSRRWRRLSGASAVAHSWNQTSDAAQLRSSGSERDADPEEGVRPALEILAASQPPQGNCVEIHPTIGRSAPSVRPPHNTLAFLSVTLHGAIRRFPHGRTSCVAASTAAC